MNKIKQSDRGNAGKSIPVVRFVDPAAPFVVDALSKGVLSQRTFSTLREALIWALREGSKPNRKSLVWTTDAGRPKAVAVYRYLSSTCAITGELSKRELQEYYDWPEGKATTLEQAE